MSPVRIAIVAGEASGDLLGSQVVSALKAHLPDARFYGIGGPRMISAGVHSLFPMETLSVRGYVEALRGLPQILRIRRELKAQILREPPDLFIGIDAPDFNLGLETAFRRRGIRTVHVASPSLWGWRGKRMKQIKRAVDRMLVLFPFEESLYVQAQVPATYVGHPLADEIPLDPDFELLRERLKLAKARPIIALLPGSRQSELQLHSELFIDTAREILAQRPTAQFLVPLATRETRGLFEEALYRKDAQALPLTIMFGHAQDAMLAADAVLVASGTATLEAALCKKPMVITYRVPKLTAWLVKARAYIPYLGLPNVLAGRFVVPELLQEDATAENLAQALLNQLQDEPVTQALQAHFRALHLSLKQDMRNKAAEAILDVLGRTAHA